VSFQWFRGGAAIGGATATTYTLVAADVGTAISVRATMTDGFGTVESLTSVATSAVVHLNTPMTGGVSITNSTSGSRGTTTAREGDVLALSSTLADADGLGTLVPQWLRNGLPLSGAVASTYTLVQADVGAVIAIRVAQTDARGTTESATSAATNTIFNVDSPLTGAATVVNLTSPGRGPTSPRVDDTLSVSDTLADDDGITTRAYQWYRDGIAIPGATADSYSLSSIDLVGRFSVRVTASDAFGGSGVVASSATGIVTTVLTQSFADGFGLVLPESISVYNTLDFSACTLDLTYTINANGTVQVKETARPTFNSLIFASAGDVVTGSGINRFVFNGTGSLAGTITGSDTGTTILDYSAATGAVAVNLDAGTATGTDGVTKVTQVIGSTLNALTGGNTLTASRGGSLWSLTTAGSGSVGGVAFSRMHRLVAGSLDDVLDYSAYATGVTVNLATGTATGYTSISGFRNVIGSAFNDSITGDTQDNVFSGGMGINTLVGGGGSDVVMESFDADMTLTDGRLTIGTGGSIGRDDLSGFS
ncbi:MAG: hypothetical protein WCO99_15565, partial [Planctomycetota bacterium]